MVRREEVGFAGSLAVEETEVNMGAASDSKRQRKERWWGKRHVEGTLRVQKLDIKVPGSQDLEKRPRSHPLWEM